MIARLKRLVGNSFVKQVSTVAAGVAGAQAINMAFTPILTRIYSPDAIGALGTFMSITAMLVPVAAVGYPIAIVLPKRDDEAVGLVRLSLLCAAGVAGLTAVIVLLFRDEVASALGLEEIARFFFLIPALMLVMACVDTANQWAIRKKRFRFKAKVTVLQALVIGGAKTGFGYFNPVAGVLVLATVAGRALHPLIMSLGLRRTAEPDAEDPGDRAPVSIPQLARRFRDFPLYRAPQNLINAASMGLPVILLASLFGMGPAGFYSLARSLMGLPLALVAQSVGEVIYPRLAEASHRGQSLRPIIVKGTLGLAAVGVVPFLAVVVFGPSLFGFVFGDEWTVSGEYARWLAVMVFFNFINRPAVAAVAVLGLQRGLLIYELFSTGAKVAAMYVGFAVFEDDMVAVALFSTLGALAYIVLIVWVVGAARRADGRDRDAE